MFPFFFFFLQYFNILRRLLYAALLLNHSGKTMYFPPQLLVCIEGAFAYVAWVVTTVWVEVCVLNKEQLRSTTFRFSWNQVDDLVNVPF